MRSDHKAQYYCSRTTTPRLRQRPRSPGRLLSMGCRQIAGARNPAPVRSEAQTGGLLAWYRQYYSELPGRRTARRLGLLPYVLIGLLRTVVALRVPSYRAAAAFALLPLALFLLTNAL